VDTALYQDAKVRHLRELIRMAEEFAAAWDGYSESLREWLQEMTRQIARETKLPPLHHGPGMKPYAAHNHLAVFIYKRVCRIQSGSLEKSSTGAELWCLMNGSVNVAMGSPKELEYVIEAIDQLRIDQQPKGDFFVRRARELAEQLESLKGEVRLALAGTKLPRGCNLVKFW
jgi:hypothetical protein